MSVEEIMRKKLSTALNPVHLHIENQSHLHKGHAGDDGSGESHFYIEITSSAFADQSKVARHRIVHDILGSDITNCIHSISFKLKAPE